MVYYYKIKCINNDNYYYYKNINNNKIRISKTEYNNGISQNGGFDCEHIKSISRGAYGVIKQCEIDISSGINVIPSTNKIVKIFKVEEYYLKELLLNDKIKFRLKHYNNINNYYVLSLNNIKLKKEYQRTMYFIEYPLAKSDLKHFINNMIITKKRSDILSGIKNLLIGLSIFHINNIYHGDIKPENILYFNKFSTNLFKLGDFGGISIIESPNNITINNATIEYLPGLNNLDNISNGKLIKQMKKEYFDKTKSESERRDRITGWFKKRDELASNKSFIEKSFNKKSDSYIIYKLNNLYIICKNEIDKLITLSNYNSNTSYKKIFIELFKDCLINIFIKNISTYNICNIDVYAMGKVFYYFERINIDENTNHIIKILYNFMYTPYKCVSKKQGLCSKKQDFIGVVKSSKIPNILQVIALWNTCIILIKYDHLYISDSTLFDGINRYNSII